ncbi:MAG TPA: hypothetical protein VEQ35_05890 [Beijerinckia sp.]|jgi:hypothetical protein|nr:hypothetical protein [Beijerinckia sp.]
MLVSAEVRWFFEGDCPADVQRWFHQGGPSPGGGDTRIDEYLWQPNETQIGIKRRGGQNGVEIKGLVACRRTTELSPFAPYFETWCKWSAQASGLQLTETLRVQKTRWLRVFDTSGPAVEEVLLGADAKPLSGHQLPVQGCNVEITKVELAAHSRPWWTLGFEAYGDLEQAPYNLRKAIRSLDERSFPRVSTGEFLNYPSWLARVAKPER